MCYIRMVVWYLIHLNSPRLKEHMQYCITHPEEMSKISKLKAQITEVKDIMMDNIEKVCDFDFECRKCSIKLVWIASFGLWICCTKNYILLLSLSLYYYLKLDDKLPFLWVNVIRISHLAFHNHLLNMYFAVCLERLYLRVGELWFTSFSISLVSELKFCTHVYPTVFLAAFLYNYLSII